MVEIQEKVNNNIVTIAIIVLLLTVVIEGFVMATAYTSIINEIGSTTGFSPVMGQIDGRMAASLMNEGVDTGTIEGYASNFEPTNTNDQALDEYERNVNIPNFISGLGTIFWIVTRGWIVTMSIILGQLASLGFLGYLLAIAVYFPIIYTLLKTIFGGRVKG